MTGEVEQRVLTGIRQRCDDDQAGRGISADTRLRDLHLDSLTVLELIYELEEHYKIIVDDQQLLSLETVADIVLLVSQAQAAVDRH